MHRTENHLDPEPRRPLPSLPISLLGRLSPKGQRALTHRTRWDILRAFEQDPTPRGAEDLLSAFPKVQLETIIYHFLVLEECGSLAVSHIEQSSGHFVRAFRLSIGRDPEISAVLKETEQLDGTR